MGSSLSTNNPNLKTTT